MLPIIEKNRKNLMKDEFVMVNLMFATDSSIRSNKEIRFCISGINRVLFANLIYYKNEKVRSCSIFRR